MSEQSEGAHEALAILQHQVKNSFQSITSYLRLSSQGRVQLLPPQIDKLAVHVQMLTFIHDVTYDRVVSKAVATKKSADVVPVHRLIETILQSYSRKAQVVVDSLSQCAIKTKKGITLGIILNEIVSNAIHHGSGVVSLSTSLQSNEKQGEEGGELLIVVSNSVSDSKLVPGPAEAALASKGGFHLAQSLSKADFGNPITISTSEGFSVSVRCLVHFDFSLLS